jgi:ParB family chromosome partitioning protein
MQEPRATQELRELPVDVIEPNLSQPRRYFDEASLEALAVSVGERGVLQPVLVRPLQDGKYQLVAGERRWLAAKLAGLQTIPALISEYDDLAALEVGLIENMAREDLNPIEEARACATLVSELGLTYRQLGERVGRGTVTVWNLVHLLELPVEVVELLERGDLSKGHGTALLVAKDPQVRSRLAGEAIEQGWSTRTLEARAHESNVSEPKEGPGEVGLEGERERERDAAQEPDLTAMNVARVWGDLLGVGVGVRALGGRQLRLEAVFPSAAAALNVGGNLTKLVARAKKRRS